MRGELDTSAKIPTAQEVEEEREEEKSVTKNNETPYINN